MNRKQFGCPKQGNQKAEEPIQSLSWGPELKATVLVIVVITAVSLVARLFWADFHPVCILGNPVLSQHKDLHRQIGAFKLPPAETGREW